METQSSEMILHAVESGKFAELIGCHEDVYFEAKGGTAYDLGSPEGRYELAKDVSSFANEGGGLIVIGLEHEKDPERAVDVVRGLQLIPETEFNTAQYEGIIREYVYPPIQGVDCKWIKDEKEPSLGTGLIRIPQQSSESKPYIITHIVEDGMPVKQIVVGYAHRAGPDSIPHNPKQMQQSLKKGMEPASQRLTRMEDKIDTLLEQQAGKPPPVDDNLLLKRILRIQES